MNIKIFCRCSFFPLPGRAKDLSAPLYKGYHIFRGSKATGRGVDHSPHLAPRLKKEYSYTSTPPLGLRYLF
jgi:hypothetical protein